MLGTKQSGTINSIGYNYYNRLLETAIDNISAGKTRWISIAGDIPMHPIAIMEVMVTVIPDAMDTLAVVQRRVALVYMNMNRVH